MRNFPHALIAIGVFGLLKHYGFIDPEYLNLFWPLLLIGIGVAMLARGPRWRADMRERMQDRWERRLQRRFGPGWANLSEEERERFRAGMRQGSFHGACGGDPFAPTAAGDGPSPRSPAQSPPPGQQR